MNLPKQSEKTVSEIEAVFHLLKRHGLGSERTTATWARVPDADKLVMERAIAERILKYLS